MRTRMENSFMAPIPINQTANVGTTLAAIGTPITLNGLGRDVSVAIQNTGSNALTHFKIQRQHFDGAPWVDWLADTDFATATSKCCASGGSAGNLPQTLPAGSTAWIDFDPGAVVAIQFCAAATSATSLILQGGARLETME